MQRDDLRDICGTEDHQVIFHGTNYKVQIVQLFDENLL